MRSRTTPLSQLPRVALGSLDQLVRDPLIADVTTTTWAPPEARAYEIGGLGNSLCRADRGTAEFLTRSIWLDEVPGDEELGIENCGSGSAAHGVVTKHQETESRIESFANRPTAAAIPFSASRSSRGRPVSPALTITGLRRAWQPKLLGNPRKPANASLTSSRLAARLSLTRTGSR
jgi:hypothetical protein